MGRRRILRHAARDDVPRDPQRLLDVDRRDAGHGDRVEHDPPGRRASRRGPRRGSPNSSATGPVVVGHDQPPALASAARGAPARRSPSSAQHRHRGLHRRDRQRVVEQRARAEAAVLHPLQRERLDRRAALVGVEPDVAEEDAVGLRDRLLAQRDRLRRRGTRPTARAGARAAPAGWARARASSSLQTSQQAGELLPRARGRPRPGGPPAPRSCSPRRSRSTSARSASSSPAGAARCPPPPPASAKVIVGQTATAYAFATAPSSS